MKDTEQVTIFKSAKEAATAVLTGTGAAIHVAAAAMEVWSDPSFETVSSFVETARKKSGDVIDGVAGIDKLRGLARQMSGTFEVSGAAAQLPAVPPSLTESFGGAAAAAGSVPSMVPGLALGVGLLNLGVGCRRISTVARGPQGLRPHLVRRAYRQPYHHRPRSAAHRRADGHSPPTS